MEQIKNTMIAAIVAAIILVINDPNTTDASKASLSDQVTSLYALDKELTAAASAPNTDLEAANANITKLKLQFSELTDQYEEDTEDAKAMILDLKAQLKTALEIKVNGLANPVGETSDGVKYEIVSGAHGYGSAKEIAADPAILDKLVKLKVKPLL